MNKTYTSAEIADKTRLYFEGINNIENKSTPNDLMESAQANVMTYKAKVMDPYNEGKITNTDIINGIEAGKNIYHAEHPEDIVKDLDRTAEITVSKNPTLALVKKEEYPLSKTGFINAAILIYGLINVGIILAIAFLK